MQSAHLPPRKPVVLDRAQINGSQLLQRLRRPRPLDRQLRVVVAEVIHMHARHPADNLPHPLDIFLPRPRVDDDQVVVVRKFMHHHIVNKRPIRIQHRRVLCLPNGQLRRIIHAELLHRSQRPRSPQLNIAHMRNVEDAYTRAHGHMLGDQARILDRHIPAAKIDHLGLCRTMHSVQRSFTKCSCISHRLNSLGKTSTRNFQR